MWLYEQVNMRIEGCIIVSTQDILHQSILFKEKISSGGRPQLAVEKRPVDKGAIDYVEVMFALKLHNWDGWFSFEEFVSQEPSAVADEVKKGIEHLKWCRQESKNSLEIPFLPFNF